MIPILATETLVGRVRRELSSRTQFSTYLTRFQTRHKTQNLQTKIRFWILEKLEDQKMGASRDVQALGIRKTKKMRSCLLETTQVAILAHFCLPLVNKAQKRALGEKQCLTQWSICKHLRLKSIFLIKFWKTRIRSPKTTILVILLQNPSISVICPLPATIQSAVCHQL